MAAQVSRPKVSFSVGVMVLLQHVIFIEAFRFSFSNLYFILNM